MAIGGGSLGELSIRLGLDLKELSRGAAQAVKELGKISKKAGEVGKKMSNLGKKMSMRVTAPLAVMGGFALKSAADFERLRVELGVLLGDAGKGIEHFNELLQFSARTPLKIKGLARSSKQLLAVGVKSEDVVGTLRTLGDLAAGDQERLNRLVNGYMRVKTVGKATMEELRIFAEAGVPVFEALAKELGKGTDEIMEMSSKGQLSFDVVDKALRGMTAEGGRFNGMMDKISKTLGGRFSTLVDNISIALESMIAPLLPDIKRFVSWLTELAQKFNRLSPAIKKIAAIGVIIVATIGPALIVIGAMLQGFAFLVASIPFVVAGFKVLLFTVAPIAIGIAAVTAVVLGLIEMVKAAGVEFDIMGESGKDSVDDVSKSTTTLIEKIANFASGIGYAIDLVKAMWQYWITGFKLVGVTLGTAGKNIGEFFFHIVTFATESFSWLADNWKLLLKDMLNIAMTFAKNFGTLIKESGKGALNFINEKLGIDKRFDVNIDTDMLKGFERQSKEFKTTAFEKTDFIAVQDEWAKVLDELDTSLKDIADNSLEQRFKDAIMGVSGTITEQIDKMRAKGKTDASANGDTAKTGVKSAFGEALEVGSEAGRSFMLRTQFSVAQQQNKPMTTIAKSSTKQVDLQKDMAASLREINRNAARNWQVAPVGV
jgi:tape measure domain-containing protein